MDGDEGGEGIYLQAASLQHCSPSLFSLKLLFAFCPGSNLSSCFTIAALVLPQCSTMLRLLNETQAFKHDIEIV